MGSKGGGEGKGNGAGMGGSVKSAKPRAHKVAGLPVN